MTRPASRIGTVTDTAVRKLDKPSVALFHARELLKLEYNAANLEMVLFFYDIPDKLIKKSEAESIAKELQRIDPDNKVALHILSGCSWTQLNTNGKDSQTDLKG